MFPAMSAGNLSDGLSADSGHLPRYHRREIRKFVDWPSVKSSGCRLCAKKLWQSSNIARIICLWRRGQNGSLAAITAG